MKEMRTCQACGHVFPKHWWRGWNAVDVRYEKCPKCRYENGYESQLYRWLRLRKERKEKERFGGPGKA
jgi:hypothetical protein